MRLRLRLLACALAAAGAALPAQAADGLAGRYSGSTRTEAGIVSVVLEVQPQRIGRTAGTLSFRGVSDWDCNAWVEYAGAVEGTHAFLPRRRNDDGQGIDNGCSMNNAYVEVTDSGPTLRWFKDGKALVEVPLTAEK